MEKKKSILQFIKFALVGIMNTLIDTVVSMALNALLHWYYPAKIIGYCCGIVNSYILNSGWTFKTERKRNAREIISFIAVNLAVLGISLLLMALFRDVVGISDEWLLTWLPEWFVKIFNGERVCMLLSTGISLIINFFGNKFIVFASGGKNDDNEEAKR